MIGATNGRSLVRAFAVIAICIAIPVTAYSQPKNEKADRNPCSTEALPHPFQQKLMVEFGSWRIQEITDLSPSAKARWVSAEYADCPGIAAGEFRENKRRSYAVLLVSREKPDSAYRLAIYTPDGPDFKEEFQILDKGDSARASNFFLYATKTNKLFDGPSRRKFHIENNDSFLFFDCGEQEYEVDAYFYADGAYHNSPVDM